MKASHRAAVELAHALGRLRFLDGIAVRDDDDLLWLIHKTTTDFIDADELPDIAPTLLGLGELRSIHPLAEAWGTVAERVTPERLAQLQRPLARLKSGRRAAELASRGGAALRSFRDRNIPRYVNTRRRRYARLRRWSQGRGLPERVGPGLELLPLNGAGPIAATRCGPAVGPVVERRLLLAARATAALVTTAAGQRVWRELYRTRGPHDEDILDQLLNARLRVLLAAPLADVSLPANASGRWLGSAEDLVCDLSPDKLREVWHLATADPSVRCPDASVLSAPLPVAEALAARRFPWVPRKARASAATVTRYLTIRSELAQTWSLQGDTCSLAANLAESRPTGRDTLNAFRLVRDQLARGTSLEKLEPVLANGGPHVLEVKRVIELWRHLRLPRRRPPRFDAVRDGLEVPTADLYRYLVCRELCGHGATFSKTLLKPLLVAEGRRDKLWKRARNAFRRAMKRFSTSGLREALDHHIAVRARDLFGKRVATDAQAVDILSGLAGARNLAPQTLAGYTRQLLQRSPLEALPPNQRWVARAEDRGVNVNDWLEGFSALVELEGRSYRVRTACSPQEVAHMGSHFGTCMSLHTGMYRSSVPINALDANKHVVTVTEVDGERRWIARKLIAISTHRRMVGFELYTNGGEDEGLQAAVDDVIASFAQRIGLPLSDTGDVEQLHAGYWYDDGTEPWKCGVRAMAARATTQTLRNALDTGDLELVEAIAKDPENMLLQAAAQFHVLRLTPGVKPHPISFKEPVIMALTAIGRYGTARRAAEQLDMTAPQAMNAILLGLPADSRKVGRALRELRRLKGRAHEWRVVARSWHAQLPLEQLLEVLAIARRLAPEVLDPGSVALRSWARVVLEAAHDQNQRHLLERKRLLQPELRCALHRAVDDDGEAHLVKAPHPVAAMLWSSAEEASTLRAEAVRAGYIDKADVLDAFDISCRRSR